MSVTANTQQTYAQIGRRESLEDFIYDISPMETPFVKGCKRMKAKAVYEEWLTDSLASANKDNAAVEGDTVSNDATIQTVRIGNYVQLLDKVIAVSSTADAVSTAGRKKELSLQLSKRGREIKRDIEAMALSINASSAGSASTARKSAGVGAWLTTNTSHGSGGSANGFSGGIVAAPTDGTNRALTETLFKGVIADCWDAGGDPSKVFCNSSQKQVISGFSGIATLYRESTGTKQATIMGAADVYVSDFGNHTIIPDRFMPTDGIYCIDPEFWAIKTLQPMAVEKLAKDGHANRRMLSTELVLASLNEAASGGVFDLS